MIYRTSQRGTYRNINNSLNLLSYRIAQLSNKMASEKSINKPSDDPSGAATVLRTRTALAEIAQNTENVNYSNTWLTNTGNLMGSVKNTIDEIYTKAEQASTDTYTAEQRQIIATEIDALFRSVIQFADGKFGDNYLLSGQQVNVQPFSLTQKAQTVVDGCLNSDLWTGQVQNYKNTDYVPRPDLPVQSQNFLVEVVQAGGIDSRYYAGQGNLAVLKINGENSSGDYTLRVDSQEPTYNTTQIRLVPGPENTNYTGTIGTSTEISYSLPDTYTEPFSVIYTYGDETTPTWAQYSAQSQTMTVYLQTNGGEPPKSSASVDAISIATAVNIEAAANGLPLTAQIWQYGNGHIDLEPGPTGQGVNTVINFNNKTYAEVNGNEITVYLERSGTGNGEIVATAQDVRNALNNNSDTSKMVSASLTGSGSAATVKTMNTFMSMTPSDPYTLAWTQTEVPGTHNDLVYSVQNHPLAPIGEAGNAYSVSYQWANPPTSGASTTAVFDSTTSSIVVTLGTSGAVFTQEYARLLNDPTSLGYQNPVQALYLARVKANTGDALSVMSAVTALSEKENLYLEVKLADGESGLGKVVPSGPFEFAEGYDQAALFRVSQDGGLTWGPPTAISPSEFEAGGLFYNSQLGHASLTTGFPGSANDLVFTANYMGTWGDDVRVEFAKTQGPYPNSASVTVGPQPWNICVTLGTDEKGQIVTTASEVMDLINNHPEAGQLVTASLANYHEGGAGLVDILACTSLSTAEPYEIAGTTRITPLGHATAAVAFPYEPSAQASPDLIFQALDHGTAGNNIGVRYTMSADSTLYGDSQYQDQVSISYETDALGRQIVVVHLATSELPTCPDPETDRQAYDQFREIWPLYSCSETRAVTSTAGEVLEALIAKNLSQPDQALVWASMEYKDEGWDSTAKVGPTTSTVWLSGGDNSLKASDHGVGLKFTPDGTALVVGDVFQVGVGWYNGDSNNLDVDSMSSYRTTTNITGDALLGANGASDNILDTINRLSWGLAHDDSELIAQELPKLKAALEKVTTMETDVGTKLIRNQFILNNLETDKYASETILSATEDADFTRLITDLKNSQLVYEAVLGTTGLTTKLSLLNYI
jgi:flagellin-like hook-associated protein FlgL